MLLADALSVCSPNRGFLVYSSLNSIDDLEFHWQFSLVLCILILKRIKEGNGPHFLAPPSYSRDAMQHMLVVTIRYPNVGLH